MQVRSMVIDNSINFDTETVYSTCASSGERSATFPLHNSETESEQKDRDTHKMSDTEDEQWPQFWF